MVPGGEVHVCETRGDSGAVIFQARPTRSRGRVITKSPTIEIIMKKLILSLFAFAGVAFAGPLATPLTGAGGVSCAVTNAITNTYNYRIDAPSAPELAITASFKLANGTDVGPVQFLFDTSVDGVNWSASTVTLSVTPISTAVRAVGITNVSKGAVPFYRLASIVNTNATSNLTNVTVAAWARVSDQIR